MGITHGELDSVASWTGDNNLSNVLAVTHITESIDYVAPIKYLADVNGLDNTLLGLGKNVVGQSDTALVGSHHGATIVAGITYL